MSDYSQGKVYKLYVEGLEDFPYIGSTTTSLTERLCMHRHQAKNPTQKKTASCSMFDDDNIVKIELLESYPCDSKKELEERERYWLEQYPDAININTPTQTWRERWYKNHDHNLAKHKEWIEAHKEEQAKYKKDKRLENPEEARAKDKESRERRKEKIAEAKKVKVECPECKKVMAKNSLWLHTKTIHKKS